MDTQSTLLSLRAPCRFPPLEAFFLNGHGQHETEKKQSEEELREESQSGILDRVPFQLTQMQEIPLLRQNLLIL